MDLNNQLRAMKDTPSILPREDAIRQVSELAQAACFRQLDRELMNFREFLWIQFCYTRKRWWAAQGLLLLFALVLLPAMKQEFHRVRSLGVIGCLFVVLIIPELWRNKSHDATQVEASCLYSLRQIYAARLTLFGLVDLVLLSLFCLGLGKGLGLTAAELVTQFLLPATVTACICFGMLCGKRNWSEAVSISVSLTWSGVWWLILMNEQLYPRIFPGLWLGLFALSAALMIFLLGRVIRDTNLTWEVEFA